MRSDDITTQAEEGSPHDDNFAPEGEVEGNHIHRTFSLRHMVPKKIQLAGALNQIFYFNGEARRKLNILKIGEV